VCVRVYKGNRETSRMVIEKCVHRAKIFLFNNKSKYSCSFLFWTVRFHFSFFFIFFFGLSRSGGRKSIPRLCNRIHVVQVRIVIACLFILSFITMYLIFVLVCLMIVKGTRTGAIVFKKIKGREKVQYLNFLKEFRR
jgi:hypothetical protein